MTQTGTSTQDCGIDICDPITRGKEGRKEAMVLQEQQLAPDFRLPAVKDDDAAVITYVQLAQLRGQMVVLVFVPKGDRRGNAVEIGGFRAAHQALHERGVKVFVISTATLTMQKQFAVHYHLPFQLLSDADAVVAQAYGVWIEKRLFGKPYQGVERTTMLIDPEGKVRKIWRRIRPEGHAEEVLAFVETLFGPLPGSTAASNE
jgi:thioredoxin-dependent peroxiredoxin